MSYAGDAVPGRERCEGRDGREEMHVCFKKDIKAPDFVQLIRLRLVISRTLPRNDEAV